MKPKLTNYFNKITDFDKFKINLRRDNFYIKH